MHVCMYFAENHFSGYKTPIMYMYVRACMSNFVYANLNDYYALPHFILIGQANITKLQMRHA